jgi:transcription elongation GreA/GreB family factor
MATRTSHHTFHPVTAAGKTHPDILSALVHIRKLEKLNREMYSLERTQEILKIQDRIAEIMDGIRNAEVPEGREKKTYRQDDHWGFEHVSHTYDAEGNKVRVGDTVTYLSGGTFWKIERLILNNDGNEHMKIVRNGTGYSKSMVHGEEIHKVQW